MPDPLAVAKQHLAAHDDEYAQELIELNLCEDCAPRMEIVEEGDHRFIAIPIECSAEIECEEKVNMIWSLLKSEPMEISWCADEDCWHGLDLC